jgi:type III secretion system YscQ/HrcQ family protein
MSASSITSGLAKLGEVMSRSGVRPAWPSLRWTTSVSWGRDKAEKAGAASTPPGVWSAWPREHWTAEAARISRRVGAAHRIVLDSAEEAAMLEILPAASGSTSSGRLIVQTRVGELMLDADGIALLCLLARLPFPAEGDRAKGRLRASLAVSRLPGPLADLQWSLGAFLEKAERDRVPPSGTRQNALLPQRLHARREDVSVYCNAWASGPVWETLLERGFAVGAQGRAARRVEELPVRFSFELGRVRTSARQLFRLGIGDVVRMPLWLDVTGQGAIVVAGWRVLLRAEPGQRLRRFTVLSIHPDSRTDPGASPVFSLQARQRRTFPTAMQPSASPTPPSPTASHTGGHPSEASPGRSAPDTAHDASGLPQEALDALPIVLVAELGTLTLDVGSLRHLAPGMVIDIEASGSHEVTLRALDGQVFAGGRIVDIDGQPGIQIIQLGAE